jgi:hypothetical protein
MTDKLHLHADRAGLLGNFVDRLREHYERHHRARELDMLESHELARMAADLGLSSHDLSELAEVDPDHRRLFEENLALHGLPEEMISPATLRAMEIACTRCNHKDECACDLATGADASAVDAYCPNAETIQELAAHVA